MAENEELIYLDDILKELKNSRDYSLSKESLFNGVSGYKFQHDYYAFLEKLKNAKFITNHNLHNEQSLNVALNFLLDKKFILSDNGLIRLSFEGLIFISKGGYKKENERFHTDIKRNTIIFGLALFSFVISLLAILSPFLTNSGHTCPVH